MSNPFKIFPSVGYKNTQFQIATNHNNLRVEILKDGHSISEIILNSEYPTLLTRLEKPGHYDAICTIENVAYQQKFEVKDAVRLGTSVLKNAFVFDELEYSFLLMKDRLLLLDEKRNILYTENSISPTDVQCIDNENVLFVTNIGKQPGGISNFGLYNLKKLEITDELLNDYRAISINVKEKILCLYDHVRSDVVCFQINGGSLGSFTERFRVREILKYEFSSHNTHLFIETRNEIVVVSLSSLESTTIEKSSSVSIDKDGLVYEIKNNSIVCSGIIHPILLSVESPENLNLISGRFYHIGADFKISPDIDVLVVKANEISQAVKSSLDQSKSRVYHSVIEGEEVKHKLTYHDFYPASNGLFIHTKTTTSRLTGIVFNKDVKGNWISDPKITKNIVHKVSHKNDSKERSVIQTTASLSILFYSQLTLAVVHDNKQKVLQGSNVVKEFPFQSQLEVFHFSSSNKTYLFETNGGKQSIYHLNKLSNNLIGGISVLNTSYVADHSTIWYPVTDKVTGISSLKGFNLEEGRFMLIKRGEAQHSKYKDFSELLFNQKYIESSNGIIINPKNGDVLDATLGKVMAVSNSLKKIITRRDYKLYFLKYDAKLGKYVDQNIQIAEESYRESYLSPNGRFLVLGSKKDEYKWYDIERDEVVNFFSGKFLAFSKEGNLIINDDKTRAVKIFDPLTFEDITPPNYHYYRFLSPDGKLYAQVAKQAKFFDRVQGKYVSLEETVRLRRLLDEPVITKPESELLKRIAENKLADFLKRKSEYYNQNKSKLSTLGVNDIKELNSYRVIQVRQFTEIGICGTDKVVEIYFPDSLQYYNYAAFSYDNKFFGYVGKPSSDGLIHLFHIDFDESRNHLDVVDSYLSRYPRYASWVCGFSKTGYFATYDSSPDTYLVKCDTELFTNKVTEEDIREKKSRDSSSVYSSCFNWKIIKEKNFLCFSPAGNFLALSEQGYEPLTAGGYGHQESSAIHIAKTENGRIMASFLDHGDKLVESNSKKVAFVAFSEDERRIMSMSLDGVVVVRDIHLS